MKAHILSAPVVMAGLILVGFAVRPTTAEAAPPLPVEIVVTVDDTGDGTFEILVDGEVVDAGLVGLVRNGFPEGNPNQPHVITNLGLGEPKNGVLISLQNVFGDGGPWAIVFSSGDYANVHGFGMATIVSAEDETVYLLEGALIFP